MTMSPSLSEVEGETVPYYPPSVFAKLAEPLRSHPHRTAIICTHQPADHLCELAGRSRSDSSQTNGLSDHLSWSYEELHHAALRIVLSLRAQGVGRNSTVVTIIPNTVEWLVLYWASFVGQFTIAPFDFGVASPPRKAELTSLLSVIQADAVFVQDAKAAAVLDQAQSSLEKQLSCKVVLDSSTPPPKAWTVFNDLSSATVSNTMKAKIEQLAETDDMSRQTLIVFTSGTTTGQPKGCARTVQNQLHACIYQGWGYDLGSSTRHLLQTQNFRIIAASMALGTWMMGGTLIMPGTGFNPALVLDAIEKEKITYMIVVPAMVHMLAAHANFKTADTSSLRVVGVGADMITREIYEKASRTFPSAEVEIGHGMSEGGAIFCWPFRGKRMMLAPELPWYASIGTVGKANYNSKVRVVDESNQLIKRGEVGELHLSNPGFIRHYLGGIKPEDFYVDNRGEWFKSGDIGRIDKEGFIWILGRKKDIVKKAGVTIMPAGLENCIDEFLKSTTSIIAVPHPVLGQEPFAVVQDLNGKSKKEVEERIIEYFGKDSSLGGVATLTDLGLKEFPLNKTEKIVKRELEPAVMAYLAASNKSS